MSRLLIEAGRVYLCHSRRRGVRIQRDDSLPRLRSRTLGVHIVCRRHNRGCPGECSLARLSSKLDSVEKVEPVIVVDATYAKLFATGKLVKLEEVYSYEK